MREIQRGLDQIQHAGHFVLARREITGNKKSVGPDTTCRPFCFSTEGDCGKYKEYWTRYNMAADMLKEAGNPAKLGKVR